MSPRTLVRTILATCVAAALWLLPGAGATAAEPTGTAAVQLSHRPARLHADGSVTVTGWLRCDPPIYSFEYSVSVVQQTGSSSAFLSQAQVLPCDGTRHRFDILVPAPDTGTFVRGAVDIGIYVGLYDPDQDQDLALEDAVSTRLRPAGHCAPPSVSAA